MSMLATAARPRRTTTTIERPSLSVVRTPALRRSIAPFLTLLITILATAMGLTLMLNTQMAVTSYEIRDTRAHLVELTETAQTLKAEVETLGSPEYLRGAAGKIGMVPASTTFIMNLQAGTITALQEGQQ